MNTTALSSSSRSAREARRGVSRRLLMGIVTPALALLTLVATVPAGAATTTAGATPSTWLRATGQVVYPDGAASTYEVVVSPDGNYRATGTHKNGAYSEAVYFDGTRQRVIFREPGSVSVETFDNSQHFAVQALRMMAAGADLTDGTSPAQEFALSFGKKLVFAAGSVAEITPREGARAIKFRQPANVDRKTGAGIGSEMAETNSTRSGTWNFTLNGYLCIRGYHQYRYTDARVYGYSDNRARNYDCYWVDIALYQGGLLGTSCQVAYYVAGGPTRTSISSATGYVSNPPPYRNRICSNHAAWAQNWELNIPWDGFTTWLG